MAHIEWQQLKDTAIAAVRAAGEHALTNRNRRHEISEGFAHDVKLQLDLECQAIAEKTILAAFPDHFILGEEGSAGVADAEYVWIIDPIDGTVNFHHGLAQWCSSIAVQHKKETVAGAVFAPMLNELFSATIDTPAECNGTIIHCSHVSDAAKALALTGVSKKVDTNPDAFPQFERLCRAVRKVRLMGAAALDICHVAAGQADVYVETSIFLWDVAAAGLIARRAGALTAKHHHTDVHLSYICTNSHLLEQISAICEQQKTS